MIQILLVVFACAVLTGGLVSLPFVFKRMFGGRWE